MSRPKKDGRYLNLYLDRTLHEEFEQFCESLGQTKTVAAERAFRMYMDAMKQNPEQIMRERRMYMFLKMKEKSSLPKTNAIILGSSGSGKCHHPWDDLKPCPCGCKERPLLMYKKEKLYFCGGATENVFAVCSVCGRYTEKSDISTTINNWNNDKTKDANMDKSSETDKKEYLKHLSEDVFIVKYKERSTGRTFEINPK